MAYPKLALARANYSQLYGVYDSGRTYAKRDILTPYHLLTLAGYVRGHGIEARIFDGEVKLMNQEELAHVIVDWGPDVAALTATTPDIGFAIETCRFIKEDDPSIITVIGGPHASAMPEDVAKYSYVDYVITGDGEKPLVEIIKERKTLNKSRPLRDKILKGERLDLAMVPMPAHDLLDYSDYQFTDPTRGQLNTASVMSTRGCPFNCFFCFHDRELRFRSVDDFISEIEYLYREKEVRYYYIYDDTFMVNRDRVFEIARRIKSLSIRDANFQCLTRANLVEPRIIEALREANFVRISMGLESGSKEILRSISKGATKDDYLKACRILSDHGVEARASFILGLPHETRKTVDETIAFSKELDLLHANFNIMTPYPGSKVYDMALKRGGLSFARTEYAWEWSAYRRWGKAIIETEELAAESLEGLQVEAQTEFYTQSRILNYYKGLFENGNDSRYFYRPLNFAWQRKFGHNVPFWDRLTDSEIIDPVELDKEFKI